MNQIIALTCNYSVVAASVGANLFLVVVVVAHLILILKSLSKKKLATTGIK